MINVAPVLSWLASSAALLTLAAILTLGLVACRRRYTELDDEPWCCICAYPTPDAVGECAVCKRKVLA